MAEAVTERLGNQATLLGGTFSAQPEKRIQRKRKREPTAGQTNLMTRMTFKQMEESRLLRETIKQLKDEIARIDHARDCEQCLMGCVIGIERYAGRSLPWYLDINNEDGYDMPES